MTSQQEQNISRDVEFLFEIGSLRYVARTWKQFGLEVENVAEHIFRVTWIALTLAKYEKVENHEKIIKMALMHDLAESRTGDVNYLTRQYTTRNETKAVEDMGFGSVHQVEFSFLMKEYEARQSIESKIVKDADTLDIELELKELKSKGFQVDEVWRQNRNGLVFECLFTNSAKKFWREIENTNVHNWHAQSEHNRFKEGDWNYKNK